jgi:hypothetical protein
MAKKQEKQAKQDLPNYFEVNTWMVLDALNTMDEATSILALIAKSSDRLTQQALYGVITVLVNAEMTLNEYLEKPDGIE